MTEMIAFSIIIPVYKAELYLKSCLDSICSQTFRDIEIICVDDASPDRSGEIIRECAKQDCRVRYVAHNVNRGLSAARNTGLSIAQGKYVLFVDADDLLCADALRILFDRAEQTMVQAVYFNAEAFHDDDPSHFALIYPYFSDDDPITGKQLLKTAMYDGIFRGSAWSQCWRRDALLENGLWFKEGLYHEDMLFSLHAQMIAERVTVINDVLYRYRIHEGSIMTNPDNVIDRKVSLLHIYGEAVEILRNVENDTELALALCGYLDALSVMLDFSYASDDQLELLAERLLYNSREYRIFRILKGLDGCYIHWQNFDYSILSRHGSIYLYGNGRVAAEVLRYLGEVCAINGVIATDNSKGYWHGFKLMDEESLPKGACLIYAADADHAKTRTRLSMIEGIHVYFPPR